VDQKIRLRKKNRKVKIRRRIALIVVLVVLLSVVGYGGYLAYKASSAVKNAELSLDRGDKSALRDGAVKPVEDHVSVLLMGVDETKEREKVQEGAVQADALLLATFNADDKTVKLVSIPRDTYTYIPVSKKMDKITHAHSAGQVKNGKEAGPDAMVDAVEGLLNVPVDYFVKFNFAAFMEIVDSIGGIEVDVPVEVDEQDSSGAYEAIHLEKGVQTLNGEQALALARTRKIDSDTMRGQRQQLVLEAIVKKVASVGNVTKVGDLIDAIDGNFKTNLSFDEMISFYQYGIDASIEKLQIEGQDAYMNSRKHVYPEAKQVPDKLKTEYPYYYIPDKKNLDVITRELREHLGIDTTYTQKYKQNNEVIIVPKIK
jgi:polyisoprenyl-teichoic acid--peptidoglycan teichoic acid transferase